MMDIQLTTGERLRIARKAAGLTQEELGKTINVGRSQISNIEKGLSELTRWNAATLSGKIGINLNWLLTGEGEMNLVSKEARDEFNRNVESMLINKISETQAPSQKESFSNILLVDAKSQDLYPSHFDEPNYLNGLKSFTIPHNKFKGGEFRAFEAIQTTITPEIDKGSIVIGKKEVDWRAENLLNGASYLFVTRTGIKIRRPLGRVDRGYIVTHSEIGGNSKEDRIQINDVFEIWIIHSILTFESGEDLNFNAREEITKIFEESMSERERLDEMITKIFVELMREKFDKMHGETAFLTHAMKYLMPNLDEIKEEFERSRELGQRGENKL